MTPVLTRFGHFRKRSLKMKTVGRMTPASGTGVSPKEGETKEE